MDWIAPLQGSREYRHAPDGFAVREMKQQCSPVLIHRIGLTVLRNPLARVVTGIASLFWVYLFVGRAHLSLELLSSS